MHYAWACSTNHPQHFKTVSVRFAGQAPLIFLSENVQIHCCASSAFVYLKICFHFFIRCHLLCLWGLLHETYRHSVHFIFTLTSCTACLISQCHFFLLIVSSLATTCSDAGGRHQQQHRLSLQLYWHTQIARRCLSVLAFSSVSHIPPSSSIPIGYVSVNLKCRPPIPSPPGDLFSLFPP